MSSACEINQTDCHHSARNRATTELPDQECVCLETGLIWTVKQKVVVKGKQGRIYRFRNVLDKQHADVEFQSGMRFMKCVPLTELDLYDEQPTKGGK